MCLCECVHVERRIINGNTNQTDMYIQIFEVFSN